MVTPITLYQQLPSLRQRDRRVAVVAAFAGFPLLNVGYAALVVTGIVPTAIWAPVAVALFAITIVGVVAIYGWGQGRIDRAPTSSTNGSGAMVDRAFIAGYGVLTTADRRGPRASLALYLSFIGPITIDMTTLTPWVIAVGAVRPIPAVRGARLDRSGAPADDDPTLH